MIETQNLTTSFGLLKAVDNVSLSVAKGTITGLIGPNGAGKSTLFNTLTGVIRPTSGEIHFDGIRTTKSPPDVLFRQGLAHTFQIPRPFPQMTVLENLMLAPTGQVGESLFAPFFMMKKVKRQEREIQAKAMDILTFTTLDTMANDPAGKLSGGQMKLLELARVLMGDPKVILLDEPAAGVSPALTEILVEKIKDLNASGHTFFIIEHDMDFIMRHCEPVIAMVSGHVVFEGSGEAARSDPQLVNAYLGDMTYE